MKIKLLFIATLATGCDTAIDQVSDCKKPATVFSKHVPLGWYDSPQMTIKDADGEMISLDGRNLLQIIDKYKVGDTIK